MPTIKKLQRKPQPKRTYDNRSGKRGERHRIYDTDHWRRLRLAKFNDSPLCEMCQKEGRITPATEIHHIVSFMSVEDKLARQALAFDYDNLMSLCSECHHKIHRGYDYDD